MSNSDSTPKIPHSSLKNLLFHGNIHHKDLPDKTKKIEIIENLEKEIEGKLLDKIKKITGRLVLFVGDNVSLLGAVGSYFYCIRGETHLYYYSLYGKDVTELNRIFSRVETFRNGNDKITEGKLLERLLHGSSIFLDGLECTDNLFIKKLAVEIEDFKIRENNKGVLIVSTSTPLAEISKMFINVFGSDVITLEPEMQGQANGQGTTQDTAGVQGLKVSFNKTDYIVTINGKEYLFEEEDKKSKKRRKLFKAYNLFELLYNTQHRYVKKDEIKRELGMGDYADQQVQNTVTATRKIVKESPYKISNQKEYDDRGGYKLILKNR